MTMRRYGIICVMGDEIKVDCRSSNAEKVRLFKSLFFGRQDVFARRFENAKKGTSGYSPCCQNQWGPACALKQHRKCSDCAARKFLPVSDEVVRWHLRGRDAQMKPFVMGAYPMESDETVRFAVIDFDKSDWRRDALFVVRESRAQGLSPALEKSRSGHGAHVWFFFATSVAARNVREVLTGILTRVLERHPEVGLDSYDRIIPCQDTLPKGGFGNLIALPLQAEPRKIDNSVFVNDDWMPHPDQWAFLSSVKRMTPLDLEAVRRTLGCNGRSLRANLSATPADGARPWAFFLPLWTAGAVMPLLPDAPSEADVNVVVANRVYIEQANLTQTLRSDLIALASFVNPEFDARQRMKYSVYGQPRVISRALNGEKYLQIPRGCLESALRTLKSARRNPVVEDKRYGGVRCRSSFTACCVWSRNLRSTTSRNRTHRRRRESLDGQDRRRRATVTVAEGQGRSAHPRIRTDHR